MTDQSIEPIESTEPTNAPQQARSADHSARLAGVRGMMLGWCLWLLGSWAVTLAYTGPTPGARWMIFAALFGLMFVWPLARLSQGPRLTHRRETPLDQPRLGALGDLWTTWFEWLCLNLIFQAVIWPLHMLADWRLTQAWWVVAAVAVWSLLSGLLIALGRRLADPLGRAGAMVGCVAIVFAEPILMWLQSLNQPRTVSGGAGGWHMHVSPIQTLWALTRDAARFDAYPWVVVILTVGLAGVVGWIGLGLWTWLAGRLTSDQSPSTRGGLGE